MKTKNIALFRRRANAHALAGHIAQGTYGEGRSNGITEYKGCFVGCLTTPHTKRSLRSFVKAKLKKYQNADSSQVFMGLNEGGSLLHQQLSSEFGLCKPLIVLIEAFFEAQRTHKQAINFIPDVAAALNEGADIRPAAVQAFVNELGLRGRPMGHYNSQGAWIVNEVPLDIKMCDYYNVFRQLREHNVPRQTQKFLTWLANQTPVAS
jgi:hypothetical protein